MVLVRQRKPPVAPSCLPPIMALMRQRKPPVAPSRLPCSVGGRADVSLSVYSSVYILRSPQPLRRLMTGYRSSLVHVDGFFCFLSPQTPWRSSKNQTPLRFHPPYTYLADQVFVVGPRRNPIFPDLYGYSRKRAGRSMYLVHVDKT